MSGIVKKVKSNRKALTTSSRAEILILVDQIQQLLSDRNNAECVGSLLPVYLGALMLNLVSKLAGAHDNNKTRSIPCHLQMAMRRELKKLLSRLTIAQRVVLPNI